MSEKGSKGSIIVRVPSSCIGSELKAKVRAAVNEQLIAAGIPIIKNPQDLGPYEGLIGFTFASYAQRTALVEVCRSLNLVIAGYN